jgi:hypothetical protein
MNVTMSQKLSLIQSARSVPRALTSDSTQRKVASIVEAAADDGAVALEADEFVCGQGVFSTESSRKFLPNRTEKSSIEVP